MSATYFSSYCVIAVHKVILFDHMFYFHAFPLLENGHILAGTVTPIRLDNYFVMKYSQSLPLLSIPLLTTEPKMKKNLFLRYHSLSVPTTSEKPHPHLDTSADANEKILSTSTSPAILISFSDLIKPWTLEMKPLQPSDHWNEYLQKNLKGI